MSENKIRDYKIEKLIGRGGMGSVYLATHVHLHTQAALKILLEHYSDDEIIKNRFVNEALLLSTLQHPNIVRQREFFEEDGRLVLAMEYVDGRGLDKMIGHEIGPIPWKTALPLIKQILEGVGCAHDNGVTHRDIKPANILVGNDNVVKITDFGIARLAGQDSMTKTGTRLGTLNYMSPEQVRGEKNIDHRSDIYSLGMTFYEMLAGRIPVDSTTTSEFDIMRSILEVQLPDPREFYPHIPEWLVKVLKKCLAKDPEARFNSCAEILEVIDRPELSDELVIHEEDTNLNTKNVLSEEEKMIAERAAKKRKKLWVFLIFVTLGISASIYLVLHNRSVWEERLSTFEGISEDRAANQEPFYQVEIRTSSSSCSVDFHDPAVSVLDSESQSKSFYVMASDLTIGTNVLRYEISLEDHQRLDSVLIVNPYESISYSSEYIENSIGSTSGFTISTEIGNRLVISGLAVDTLLNGGSFFYSINPDSVLLNYDPDEDNSVSQEFSYILSNPTGYVLESELSFTFNFPRIQISVSEPSGRSISRTGSSFTIEGSTEPGARVSITGAYETSGNVAGSGNFSRWVSVPEFGRNSYTIRVTKDQMISSQTTVSITREMTDAEVESKYKSECTRYTGRQMSAENLSDLAHLVGDKVCITSTAYSWAEWDSDFLIGGRNNTWDCVIDLSGFSGRPELGTEFTVWGEVLSGGISYWGGSIPEGDTLRTHRIDAQYLRGYFE